MLCRLPKKLWSRKKFPSQGTSLRRATGRQPRGMAGSSTGLGPCRKPVTSLDSDATPVIRGRSTVIPPSMATTTGRRTTIDTSSSTLGTPNPTSRSHCVPRVPRSWLTRLQAHPASNPCRNKPYNRVHQPGHDEPLSAHNGLSASVNHRYGRSASYAISSVAIREIHGFPA